MPKSAAQSASNSQSNEHPSNTGISIFGGKAVLEGRPDQFGNTVYESPDGSSVVVPGEAKFKHSVYKDSQGRWQKGDAPAVTVETKPVVQRAVPDKERKQREQEPQEFRDVPEWAHRGNYEGQNVDKVERLKDEYARGITEGFELSDEGVSSDEIYTSAAEANTAKFLKARANEDKKLEREEAQIRHSRELVAKGEAPLRKSRKLDDGTVVGGSAWMTPEEQQWMSQQRQSRFLAVQQQREQQQQQEEAHRVITPLLSNLRAALNNPYTKGETAKLLREILEVTGDDEE